PKQFFNFVCLTGDARVPTPNPEQPLVEFVTTWILNATQGETLLPTRPDNQRFPGYSMFGVAKLALPVRAVLDLHATTTAQTVLQALMNGGEVSTEPSVQNMLARIHTDLLTK